MLRFSLHPCPTHDDVWCIVDQFEVCSSYEHLLLGNPIESKRHPTLQEAVLRKCQTFSNNSQDLALEDQNLVHILSTLFDCHEQSQGQNLQQTLEACARIVPGTNVLHPAHQFDKEVIISRVDDGQLVGNRRNTMFDCNGPQQSKSHVHSQVKAAVLLGDGNLSPIEDTPTISEEQTNIYIPLFSSKLSDTSLSSKCKKVTGHKFRADDYNHQDIEKNEQSIDPVLLSQVNGPFSSWGSHTEETEMDHSCSSPLLDGLVRDHPKRSFRKKNDDGNFVKRTLSSSQQTPSNINFECCRGELSSNAFTRDTCKRSTQMSFHLDIPSQQRSQQLYKKRVTISERCSNDLPYPEASMSDHLLKNIDWSNVHLSKSPRLCTMFACSYLLQGLKLKMRCFPKSSGDSFIVSHVQYFS